MKNMPNIGTLIVLSSSGAARNGNWRCLGGYGIVTEIDWRMVGSRSDYPIKCKWFVAGEAISHSFKKYEIKKLKAGHKLTSTSWRR